MRLAAAAVLMAVGLGGAAVCSAAAPKIQFDKTEYDFGVVSQVPQITGTFAFSNAGDADLKDIKAFGTCSCTVTEIKPDTLKPGEKGQLKFTISLSGPWGGHLEKAITVTSSDPQNPTQRLLIKADIKRLFETNPAQVYFSDVHQGVTTNMVVELRRTDGKKLSITNVVNRLPLIHVRIEPGTADTAQSARLVVEATTKGQPQLLNDVIQIFTDDTATNPSIMIPVFGRVIPDVTVSPPFLAWSIRRLSRLTDDQMKLFLSRTVQVACTRPGQSLEVRGATSTLKDLSLQVITVETGKVYRVTASLPEAPKESERGTITIETSLEGQPQLVVPVNINVMAR